MGMKALLNCRDLISTAWVSFNSIQWFSIEAKDSKLNDFGVSCLPYVFVDLQNGKCFQQSASKCH
jgi:hypothetical protein